MRRALLAAGLLAALAVGATGCGHALAEGFESEGGAVSVEGGLPPSGDGGASTDAKDAMATADGMGPPGLGDAGAYDGAPGTDGGGCGYMDSGRPLHVAPNIDVCLPKVACTSETCPPQLGQCENDLCVFLPGYAGIATFPESWVTYYCDLTTQGCHGVTQVQFPEITAQEIATALSLPLCAANGGDAGECMGVAAAPPMVVGNSQEAVDQLTGKQVVDWGLGLTEASGLCYELTGPGGRVVVALTDRCGGFCSCKGSGPQECGPCVNATDLAVQCPCVGTAPPTWTSCCGTTCGGAVTATCDWCAANNLHFDLDVASFNHICGSLSTLGSCQLSAVRYFPCHDTSTTGWPPP